MAKKPLPTPRPAKSYLFHEDCPKGKIFNNDEVPALLEAGWVETPARLNLPENMDTGMTKEQVARARPEDVVAYVESLGFFVLTQEQLQAQANKMAAGAIDIQADHLELAHLPDSEIIIEVKRRGLDIIDLAEVPDDILCEEINKRGIINTDKTADQLNEEEAVFLEDFKADPSKLNKEDLVVYGNQMFSLGLRMNMKEETLIEKIQTAISKG